VFDERLANIATSRSRSSPEKSRSSEAAFSAVRRAPSSFLTSVSFVFRTSARSDSSSSIECSLVHSSSGGAHLSTASSRSASLR